jgi:hypothetical protein
MDGIGDLASLKMPSGRAAFLERMQAMMGNAAAVPDRPLPPAEALAADLVRRHADRVTLIEARADSSGEQRLMAVLDLDPPALVIERARLSEAGKVAVDVIDSATWLTIQRLTAAGMLQFVHEPRTLYRAAGEGGNGLVASA